MACDIKKMKEVQRLARLELDRLKQLQKDGKETDPQNEIDSIEQAIEMNEKLIIGELEAAEKAYKPKVKTTYTAGPKIPMVVPKVDKDVQDILTKSMVQANSYMSKIIEARLMNVTVNNPKLYRKVETWAEDNIPMYNYVADVVGDTWAGNAMIAKLKQYIAADENTVVEYNDLQSIATKAQQDMQHRMSVQLRDLDEQLEANYTQDEIAKLDDVMARSALFNIVQDGTLDKLVNTDATVEELITEIKVDPRMDKLAQQYAKIYMDEKVTETGLTNNLDTMVGIYGKDRAGVEKLATLYAIQKVDGAKEALQQMKAKTPELYDTLVGMSISVQEMNRATYGKTEDAKVNRGNLVDDIGIDNNEIVAVTWHDMKTDKFSEESGWTVLREPNKSGEFGLVYRPSVGGMEDGMGTNVSYMKSGIPVRDTKNTEKYTNNKSNGIVTSYKADGEEVKVMYLTKEEKQKLGYHRNPAKSLMKSIAHEYLLAETLEIRRTLTDSYREDYSEKKLDAAGVSAKLEDAISDDEHKLYIKLPEDVVYSKLSKAVKDKYMLVEDVGILSDVEGFNKSFDLVRKDMTDQINGYKDLQIFKSYKHQRMYTATVQLVRYVKTNMLLLNPLKIFMDLTSGISYAAAKGASISEIMDYTKEAVVLNREMTDIRNELIQAKFDYQINKTDVNKKKVDELQKKQDEHAFSPALSNGFIQSMGTELLASNHEAFSGLQVTMEKLIDKLTVDERGEFTKFNNIVKRAANAQPIQMELVYTYLGERLNNRKSTESVGKIFEEVGKELSKAKSKESMTEYLGNLLATPNSAMVRLGGAMTIYANLIPTWIIYRHNLNTGMEEQQASKEALGGILDYKKAMPKELKFMSDLYFMPFPSFFLRIQRVLLQLAKHNPVSFGAQLTINEVIGFHGQNILGSNIFSKWEKDSIFTNTFDAVKPSNLLPYAHLFGN